MKLIKYKISEFRSDYTKREAELPVFIYDLPDFGSGGIFPPLHIANQFFNEGISGGGMSPSAIWEPFTITENEYLELVKNIEDLNPKKLENIVRYTHLKYEFDTSFDHIKNIEQWIMKVGIKHREIYRVKLGFA